MFFTNYIFLGANHFLIFSWDFFFFFLIKIYPLFQVNNKFPHAFCILKIKMSRFKNKINFLSELEFPSLSQIRAYIWLVAEYVFVRVKFSPKKIIGTSQKNQKLL